MSGDGGDDGDWVSGTATKEEAVSRGGIRFVKTAERVTLHGDV